MRIYAVERKQTLGWTEATFSQAAVKSGSSQRTGEEGEERWGTPGTEEYGSSGGIRVNKHHSLFATIQLNMGPVSESRFSEINP